MTISFFPWAGSEIKSLKRLNNPEQIQAFLDKCKYNNSERTFLPNEVLRYRKAHCFDGAVFAASVLETLGYKPLVMDLRAVRDDDHVLALFQYKSFFGAVAKSNYVGLRFREPIFKTARELALSYFEGYYNLQGEKTLREYSLPFDLRKVKQIDWSDSESTFVKLAEAIDGQKHFKVLDKTMEKNLSKMDRRSFFAGQFGFLKK